VHSVTGHAGWRLHSGNSSALVLDAPTGSSSDALHSP
jgi:hypothetical protein